MNNQKELFNAFLQGKRKAKCGNVFIEDGVLYSYGQHYILAKRKNGGIWVNDERYSQSTSCQRAKLIGVLIANNYKLSSKDLWNEY
jgi:hypothetical protein